MHTYTPLLSFSLTSSIVHNAQHTVLFLSTEESMSLALYPQLLTEFILSKSFFLMSYAFIWRLLKFLSSFLAIELFSSPFQENRYTELRYIKLMQVQLLVKLKSWIQRFLHTLPAFLPAHLPLINPWVTLTKESLKTALFINPLGAIPMLC